MGIEVALIMGAIAAGAAVYSMTRSKANKDKMKPQGLDSFGMTKNTEGAVVPRVFGKVRLSSTILWYGNLESKKAYEKVGGKGIGSKKVHIGYDYYLDMWYSICQGPNITINKVYVQDRERELIDLPVDSYTFNPGDTSDYPTGPGAYACAMNPLAHIFFDRYLIGTNATTVPNFHFVVTATSSAPLTYANETNGTNPAAVIYDLLRDVEVPTAAINLASFQDAASYWHTKGVGLNLVLDQQTELKDHINAVLTYVDATLRDDGQAFYLIAHKNTDTAEETITTNEFKEFRFSRRLWDDVYTDFRANFIDEASDFSQRTIRMRNSAARALIGHDNQITIDLQGFRDIASASNRLWDMMVKMSYPEAQIQCTVPMKYARRDVGDVVGITHTDYGLSGALFRVIRKEESTLDQNNIKLELTQVLETVIDQVDGLTGGGTHWVQTHEEPAPPEHQRVLELPYTAEYGDSPAYLCLCARASNEDGFSIMKAVTVAGDYGNYTTATYFSQHGVLATQYSADTYAIDDDIGIRYTPSSDDPSFDTIGRASLFAASRIAVLYNSATEAFEIVTFQTVTPVSGSDDVILTGVIRGLMNTTPQTWAVGTEIWLVPIGDNIITGVMDGTFYLKFVPYLYAESADESDCDPITVHYRARGKTPWPPSLVKATRSGSTVTVTVWPTTRVYAGAGTTDGAGTTCGHEDGQSDQWPPEYLGSFNYSVDTWTTTLNNTNYTWDYSLAGAHTLRVKALVSGYQSIEVSVSVGAGDGDYYGPVV